MKKIYKGSEVPLYLFIIIIIICLHGTAFAQVVTYATGNAGGSGPQTQVAANINTTLTSANLVRGNCTPLGTPCTNGMSNSGTAFQGAFNFNTSGYITFSVFPNSGYSLHITDLAAGVRSSTTGCPNGFIYYSIDGGSTWTSTAFAPTVNGTCQTSPNGTANWNMADFVANSTNGVIFRIYGYGASASTSDFQLHTVKVNGTVCLLPTTPVVSVTQPTLCTSTGTITITSPTASGMTYSIDGSTYTNTTGIFTGVAAGIYSVTAKNSCGDISSITSTTVNAVPGASTLTQTGFTSVLLPQYIASGNTTRLPFFFRATLTGLCANTTYRYFVQTAIASDFAGNNPGAGNPMLINSTGSAYTYTTTPDVTSSGNYETFTSDATGSYTGWFGVVTSGNSRFTAGNVLYPTIELANTSGTIVAMRALDKSVTVLQFANSAGANNGTAIWGKSFENAKNFVFLYDNAAGSGSPLSSSCIENIGISIGSVAAFYSSNVQAQASRWGAIVPNSPNLANGVRRIEFRRFDGNITYAAIDNNGKWVSDAINTVNPTGGTTTIIGISSVSPQEDLTVYNGESSNSTTSLNTPSNQALTITGALTINTGAKLLISPNTAFPLTLQGTVSGTGTIVGSANSNLSIGGSASSLGTLYFDQSTLGTTNQINTFTLNRSSGSATLGTDVITSTSLAMTNGALLLNGNTLSVNGTVSGTGTLTGSSTSNISVGGAAPGSVGILYFTSGNRLLNNFTLSRNTAATVTLGTDLQTNGTCALTSGRLLINGNTLTLNGIYSSGTGNAGSLTGSYTSNVVIGSSATSVPLTFTYDASKVNNSLKSITINANASLNTGGVGTTSSSLYIYGGATSTSPGSVTVANGKLFTTNDSLTIGSNVNATAYVAQNTSGLSYISGKVTIERYINSAPQGSFVGRAWRLLTAPISSNQSINASWQEGFTNTAVSGAGQHYASSGYGTEITNTIVTDPSSTGFDKAVTNNPSILYLNSGAWATPASTSVNVNQYPGYMLFIRGDRTIVVSTPPFATANATTLRCQGTLNQGNATLTPPATGYQVLGNPYASEITLNNLFSNYGGSGAGSEIGTNYIVWDPQMGGSSGVGAFFAVSWNGGTSYSATTHTTAAFIAGAIESGEAFMINFANTNTLSFQEADKSTQGPMVFRPVNNDEAQSFNTILNGVDNNGDKYLVDGALTLYGDQFSDSVNWLEDAQKITNPAENLSFLRDGKLIAIEKRKILTVTDTIFLSISRMKKQSYQLVFKGENIYQNGLIARLEDNYLHQSSIVSLTDTTKYDFNVTADDASQGANRFRIVFSVADGGPLPVTFKNISANPVNNNISVQWIVANELNITKYTVERSLDGKTFTEMTNVNAVNTSTYAWVDVDPGNDKIYYRIRSIDVNGSMQYSQVAEIKLKNISPAITVYPNPVKGKTIGLQLINEPKDIYTIRLLNNVGQELQVDHIDHPGGNADISINVRSFIAKGWYQLQITNKNDPQTTIPVIIQ